MSCFRFVSPISLRLRTLFKQTDRPISEFKRKIHAINFCNRMFANFVRTISRNIICPGKEFTSHGSGNCNEVFLGFNSSFVVNRRYSFFVLYITGTAFRIASKRASRGDEDPNVVSLPLRAMGSFVGLSRHSLVYFIHCNLFFLVFQVIFCVVQNVIFCDILLMGSGVTFQLLCLCFVTLQSLFTRPTNGVLYNKVRQRCFVRILIIRFFRSRFFGANRVCRRAIYVRSYQATMSDSGPIIAI